MIFGRWYHAGWTVQGGEIKHTHTHAHTEEERRKDMRRISKSPRRRFAFQGGAFAHLMVVEHERKQAAEMPRRL
jgi:hypothetical protein